MTPGGAWTKRARSDLAVAARPAASTTATAATSGRTGASLLVFSMPRALTVLTLAVLVLAGGTGVLWSQARVEGQAEQARREAVAAARAHAETVLSYDYRNLRRHFARAQALATGKFAREYAATTSELASTARRYRVVVRAQVVAASVVTAEPGRVRTLLFVNQTTTSTRIPRPRTDRNRVRLTVRKVGSGTGSRWLVSELTAL